MKHLPPRRETKKVKRWLRWLFLFLRRRRKRRRRIKRRKRQNHILKMLEKKLMTKLHHPQRRRRRAKTVNLAPSRSCLVLWVRTSWHSPVMGRIVVGQHTLNNPPRKIRKTKSQSNDGGGG